MDHRRRRWHRRFAVGAATLSWCALALQLGLILELALERGMGWGGGLMLFFSYFTILTNILVALALTAAATRARSGVLGFFAGGAVNTAIAAAIVLVAGVYAVVLRPLWDPQGLALLADALLHYVMPALFVIHWWFGVPPARHGLRRITVAAGYPLGYFAYAVLLARFTGRYPYPFIDIEALGLARVLANALGILVLFLGIVLLLAAERRKPGVSHARAATHAAPVDG